MSHSKRAQQQLLFDFPAKPEEYAPWVAIHGLVAPYGECQCGCGQAAPIAKKTNTAKGVVRGLPARCIQNHNSGRKRLSAPPGFRVCYKCRDTKPLSDFTLRQSGILAGKYETQCRACKNIHCQVYRATTPDYHKRLRENMRAWRERKREWYRQYRNLYDAAHRAQRAEQARLSRKHSVLHDNARAAVKFAVKRGDLPPVWTMVCDHCKEAQAAEWHHFMGYESENWLMVEPVCIECHGKAHRIET